VAVHLSLPPTAVTTMADEGLLERAIASVVDNAIRYNHRGGDVRIDVSSMPAGAGFRLTVADNGPGVTEEEFRGLTAIRRFRGDEGRLRRPGAPGLGLAVAREAVDRMKLQMVLKRPGNSGFEVEFSSGA
jgi:signal transduction histidine kinase